MAAAKSVDLSEAAKRVEVLEKFPFEDDQPHVEGPLLSVLYHSSSGVEFADRAAFDSRWSEELASIQQLKEVIKTGDIYVNMLYTYRSISKALRVKNEEATRNETYEAMFEVLEPEIKKLKNFMYFQRESIKFFCKHVDKLALMLKPDKKKELETFPSQLYLWHMIQLVDRFELLDDLKNMKACLNNDFSFYKRAYQFLRKTMTGGDDQNAENHELYLFLANQNSITTFLKTSLAAITGYDDVISEMVNCAADLFENDLYLLPEDKHTLLRVMPYGLLLMDDNHGDKKIATDDSHADKNVFKSKKVKLSRFAAIFKKYPVVPLYGDMQIALEAMIRRSPHYDDRAWGTPGDEKAAVVYELIHHIDHVRQQYNEYIAKFANMVNEIKATKKDPRMQSISSKDVTLIVKEGLLYLSNWTSMILSQAAWKYAKPNNNENIDGAPDTPLDYERVVRYNYTEPEKYALVEFLAMVKTLASIMMREDSLLSPMIRHSIHNDVQDFVQVQIRDAIRSSTKKKKAYQRTDLLQLRSIGSDWYGGIENTTDPSLLGKKPSKDERIQLPSRSTPPSPTQLTLIRNITYGLFASKKHEWKDGTNKLMESFYHRSYFYEHLLNYSATIVSITDVGDLWYREFYLELGKRLQFPIDMSLPWILTDHILETKEPSFMEFVFYPLDIYNDAASRALKSLNKQFLYDEVEAEVNLCFDQLVYKLSEQIYSTYKMQASGILMDKAYKSSLEDLYPSKLHVPKSRYDVIIKQRHVQLLGRSIDLNLLISQRMNTYIRQNVDYAISRFEASDLTGVMELDSLLSNIKLTYFLMAEHFSLDPWDHILREANESTSVVSYHGRIVLHIIYELMVDFAPNMNYNSISNRFIRSPVQFGEKVQRESQPKNNPTFMYGSKTFNTAYANSDELYMNFIGANHVSAIIKLVGSTDLPLIVSECLQNMDLKIRNVLSPYVKELFGGMPTDSKLPPYMYGTTGGHGYYDLKLKEIRSYPELQSQVLRNFKEVGNLIIFLNMCETALSQLQLQTFRISAPFLGLSSVIDNNNTNNGDPSASSPLFSSVHNLVQSFESNPNLVSKAPIALKELVANAWRADKLYRPSNQKSSLFKAVLQRINQMLDSVRFDWSGGDLTPENGVMHVVYSTEFYRLWSAIQFVCCMPPSAAPTPGGVQTLDHFEFHELFGDGLWWAGISIIHFLGQKNKFETMDFTYHILNLAESLGEQNIPQLERFFKKAIQVRDLNNNIFSVLRTYSNPPLKNPTRISPPEKDQSDGFLHLTDVGSGAVPAKTLRPISTLRGGRNSLTPAEDTAPSGGFGGPPPPPPPSFGGPAAFGAPPPPPSFGAPPPPPSFNDMPPPPIEEDEDAPPPPPFMEDDDDMPPPPPPF